MSEPRLNEALRRLRDRAAAAAIPEEGKSVASEGFRSFLRQRIAEEIHDLGLETTNDMRLRLADLERKVDELIQIIGALESEPTTTIPLVENEFQPLTREPSYNFETQSGWLQRRKGGRIIAAVVVAIALAAAGLVLAAAGLMPSAVMNFLNQIAQSLGGASGP